MNLSNVSNIRFNGSNIKTIKLDGVVLYNKNKNTNVIVRYTANASGVLPSFGAYADYTVSENNNGDGTWTTVITKNGDTKPEKISFESHSNLLIVHEIDTSNVTIMSSMFYNCTNLTSVDLSGSDTSNVTNMSNMFYNCTNLTSVDLSGFDTSNVTAMTHMFRNCNSLTSLDLSGFSNSNVTNMSYMFNGCTNLTSLDLSGFDTSAVTNMSYMFQNCNSLTSLDLSGFDTSAVTNMSYMFKGCNNLTSLDVSGFDTSKVTTMGSMFYACSKLTSLDLSGFDISKVTNMGSMFNACNSLTSLNSMTNIGANLTLPVLIDQESILDVVNNLATVTTTKTLKMSATQLSWIPEDKISEVNGKGWTISA